MRHFATLIRYEYRQLSQYNMSKVLGALRTAALQTWRFLCAFFSFWFVRLHLYRWKSELHRRFFDKAWANVSIPIFLSLKDVSDYVRTKFIWKADSWKDLFDAICIPQKVQATMFAHDPNIVGPRHGNDCDEMGIWQTAAIRKAIPSGTLKKDGIVNAYLFTVMWVETDSFLPQGHNLTLLELSDGSYATFDYGRLGEKLGSTDECAREIRLRYAGSSTTGHGKSPSQSLCHSVSELDLKPIKVRFKGP